MTGEPFTDLRTDAVRAELLGAFAETTAFLASLTLPAGAVRRHRDRLLGDSRGYTAAVAVIDDRELAKWAGEFERRLWGIRAQIPVESRA